MITHDPKANRDRRDTTGRFVSTHETAIHTDQRAADHLARQHGDARWLAWQIGQYVAGVKAPKTKRTARAKVDAVRWGYKS